MLLMASLALLLIRIKSYLNGLWALGSDHDRLHICARSCVYQESLLAQFYLLRKESNLTFRLLR